MSEITPESLLIVGGTRARGRPRVAERKIALTTNVPPAYYDRIQKLAEASGEHVSVFTCKLLGDALRQFRN
jgi:hypothetical protein